MTECSAAENDVDLKVSTDPPNPDLDVTGPSMGTSEAVTRKPRSRSGFVDVGKVLASLRQMCTIRLIMASSDR